MRRMQGSTREIEVKLPFDTPATAREELARLGAKPSKSREFEDNLVFDRDDHSLERAGILLRLRTRGDRALLTVKTPVEGEHPYKIRGENQTTVGDAEATARLLGDLGFAPAWRYQKYRTKYRLGELSICLDETAIGCWVELEGPPDEIDRVARELGFTPDRYVRDTYRTLYEREAERRGEPPGDLLLERDPSTPSP